jgi:hypothetical protein
MMWERGGSIYKYALVKIFHTWTTNAKEELQERPAL